MRYLVGVGTYAMGDDGIGLRIVEEIARRGLATDFEAVDLSGSGFGLLDCFTADTEGILIVDAVRMGAAPGAHRLFAPDDVESRKVLAGISTHEGDLLQVIELGRSLGCPVPPIRILGIEPAVVAPGMELSPVLAARLDAYVAAARAAVRGEPEGNGGPDAAG
jgi:hydrogenase maturation protease